MSLYQSLYETTIKQGVPRPVIDVLARVFANDVDFQRSATPGDSIEAFYSDPDDINPRPELLCASMTVRDQTFKYYRFQTPDDNMVDFYDENGRSMRKFLVRKPIADGEMTSPFGMRYHPILHYARMHTGVDWAAPIGTPIFAAGNGTIIEAGWDGGYGRRVEIQHANGYVTTYNHMSGFGRGIVEGVHVVQGQTIGYLGDTGLATGPHLHYEVIINGSFVDPMAIKLARTREFDGKMLAAFKRERERIDQLMAQSPSAAAMAAEKPASAPVASTAELQPSATVSAPPATAPNPNAARTSPGLKPLPAQFGKRLGLTAFRQFRSVAVENEPVVPVARRWAGEQLLKQPVHGGRGKEIAPAHDVGHALQRIVHDHREMVARRQIPPAEDDVAPDRRRRRALGRNGAFAIFDPGKMRRRGGERAAHVEAEGRPARRARGGRALRPRRARGRFQDRAARRPGREGRPRRARPPSGCKSRGRRGPAGRGAPAPPRSRRDARSGGAKAQESEVRATRGRRRSRPRTAACNGRGPSLQCAESSARRLGGEALVHERRIGVAEMERAVRRRRKAQHGRGRGDIIGHGGKAHA